MPAEVTDSPPLHRPGEVTTRPKGILKNPSFSGASGQGSPDKEETPYPPSAPLDPQQAQDITIQNTLQNAGHRRSSSAARRSSASRQQSISTGTSVHEEDAEKQRLKWDEANLYLAEQESGGRMKITEPKTPYQYGDAMNQAEDDEDVAIDPRFVNVDEMDMVKSKREKSVDIPGLDIGEAEDVSNVGPDNDRIVRGGSLSRETSKDKHVSVSGSSDDHIPEQVGMPTREEQEQHRQFEERRKRHYEMSSVKSLLGHPEELDRIDDADEGSQSPKALPDRGVNGA